MEEKRKHLKRGAHIEPGDRGASLLLESFGSAALMSQGCVFLRLPNKTEL